MKKRWFKYMVPIPASLSFLATGVGRFSEYGFYSYYSLMGEPGIVCTTVGLYSGIVLAESL